MLKTGARAAADVRNTEYCCCCTQNHELTLPLPQQGKYIEGLLHASSMRLQGEIDGRVGTVVGEVDEQGRSELEELDTMFAERAAAEDYCAQGQAP